MKITQQELESRLWGAANALRGPVDPADFKTYVFPMLFWKWISDTWLHERAQAVADFGDALNDEVEADYHRFAVPDGARWDQVTTKTANLGVEINKALGQIEAANAATLANVFGDAQWGNTERIPTDAIVALINNFNAIDLDPDSVGHDALGAAYEYLLKQFAEASGKKAGEFFTPPIVTHLLVNILDPQSDEEVYDPACGSGGMLVETINAVEANGGDSREVRLYGQEVNLTTSAIARMNLAFHRKVGQSELERALLTPAQRQCSIAFTVRALGGRRMPAPALASAVDLHPDTVRDILNGSKHATLVVLHALTNVLGRDLKITTPSAAATPASDDEAT